MSVRFGLAGARHVLDAALAKADGIGRPVNVAVVDGGGHLLAFARQDGAILASADIAARKARTAVLTAMTTEQLGREAAPGGPLYGIEVTNGGLVIFGGGIPLAGADGAIAGAIGVSGGSVEQDVTVARAGAGAFQDLCRP
ncbi:heme-binding protein [Streptosporangium sp. NPDC048865]|uniref:GlcG/HbpS family heme-binding protein n=1 Tax=Streptosporangium sp. NPDC048865 TaxID=3155766 RepID=UPI00341E8613